MVFGAQTIDLVYIGADGVRDDRGRDFGATTPGLIRVVRIAVGYVIRARTSPAEYFLRSRATGDAPGRRAILGAYLPIPKRPGAAGAGLRRPVGKLHALDSAR